MSSSSPEPSSSPAPTRKKRQVEAESSDSSDYDALDAEEDSNTPLPTPPTEVTVVSHAERRRQKKRQKLNQAAVTSESASPRKKRKLDDGSPSSVHVNANANANANAATKTKSTPATDDPKRQKHQNSIWVGNLSFRTTQDALRGFFDGVGTITRVHMPMRRGKQMQDENMGFAYVDFDTPDAKTIAITLSEGQLDGRNLLIKDGDDFTGRPVKSKTECSEETGDGTGEGGKVTKIATTAQGKGLSKTAQKILRAQKQPPAPTLFLGNLGFETTDESIRELFEAHRYWGPKDKGKGVDIKAEEQKESQGGDAAKSKDVWIRKIRMGTFEDSGTCKGFAFVDFTSIEHATETLVNPRNHRLNGRDLVVEYASPDAVRRGGGGPRYPKGEQGQKSRSGSGNGNWKAPQKDFVNAPYSKQRKPQRHTKQGDGEDAEAAEIPAETKTPRHDRSHTRRTRPGAALAHALRQSAAILPGQGQKIVFEG